jgi:predicted secreted protein
LRLPPIEIKTVVAGRRPGDARADVWLVQTTDSERELPLRIGDEVVLRLPEVPSSGYAWTLEQRHFSALKLLEDQLDAPRHDELYGAATVRRVLLRATGPGVDDVVIGLRRPWEPDNVGKLVVHAHVVGEPTGDAPSGLVRSQQLQRALVA